MTVLVPGAWAVQQGQEVTEDVGAAIANDPPDTAVQTHLEPRAL